MYVCVCNKVTDRDLQQAVAEGAQTLNELQRALKLGTNCGSCLPLAHSMLNGQLKEMVTNNADLFYAA